MVWEILSRYGRVFLCGGLVCLVGQILINKTKMTSARILVTFLLAGVVLQAVGLFDAIKEFALAGVTIPIIGFGSTLAEGAIEGAKIGLFEACTYGLRAVAGGLTAAIVFGFVIALLFRSRSKTA